MGWVNHPLLVSQSGEAPPPETYVGFWSACVGPTTASPTDVTITKSTDLTGIEAGDYLVVTLINSTYVLLTGTSPLAPTAYPTVLTGWEALYTPQSSTVTQLGCPSVYGRFVESGDTSYTFRLAKQFSTNTLCWYATAYRGLSRRNPIDYIRNEIFAGSIIGNRQYMIPCNRQHGTTGEWGNWFLTSSGPSGTLYSPSSSNLKTDGVTISNVSTEGSNVGKCRHFMADRTVGYPTNRISGQKQWGSTGVMDSWATTNCSINTTSGTTAEFDELALVRDNTSKPYYISNSFSATSGEEIFVRFRASMRSSGQWLAMVVLNPSGTQAAGLGINPSGSLGFTDFSGTLTAPNAYGSEGFGTSGSPSYTTGDAWFRFTAGETGTFAIRLYAMEASGTSFSWNAGTSGTLLSDVGLLGCSVTASYYPEFAPSGQTSDTYHNNFVPRIMWDAGGAISDGVSRGGLSYQLVPDTIASFNSPKMLRQYDCGRWGQISVDGLGRDIAKQVAFYNHDGSTQYPVSAIKANQAKEYIAADRCVHPTYRLTEDGADTDGKYYWEVTCAGLSDDEVGIGIIQAGIQAYDKTYVGADWSVPFYAVFGDGVVAGTRTTYTHLGASVNNSVLSFALDIPGGTLAIYVDGTLNQTITMNRTRVDTICAWKACWFGTDDDTTSVLFDAYTVAFNFTGPFTYSKPSGYVAYDLFNEVA